MLWLTPLLYRCCLKFCKKKRFSRGVLANTARSLPFFLEALPFSWAPDGITDFGIAQFRHCNLVCCSFVLRIDLLKRFLTDHATTCGATANGLNNFICAWCNTTIVTFGRKVRFHHTLPSSTKQRFSSAAATSRLYQKFGIIDTSVVTSDILTWHQMWCVQINFWCLIFCQQIWCWLGCCFCVRHFLSF